MTLSTAVMQCNYHADEFLTHCRYAHIQTHLNNHVNQLYYVISVTSYHAAIAKYNTDIAHFYQCTQRQFVTICTTATTKIYTPAAVVEKAARKSKCRVVCVCVCSSRCSVVTRCQHTAELRPPTAKERETK